MNWVWWFLVAVGAAIVVWEGGNNFRVWRVARTRQLWVGEWEQEVAEGHWDRASERMALAMKASPEDPWVYYAKGFMAYRRNRIGEAKEALDRAIMMEPELWPARYLRAHLGYYALGRKDEAIKDLIEMVTHGHEEERAINTLGLIYLFEGDFGKGRDWLEKGLKRFQTPELYNSLGLSMFKEGRLEEALALFQAGVAKHPDHSELLMNLGNLYAMRMDYPEAEAVFDKCARLNPEDPLIAYWRGCVLAARRAYPEAEAQLHRAIDLQPNLAIAYHQLAKVLERSGHLEQARQAFQTGVQLDPKLAEEG